MHHVILVTTFERARAKQAHSAAKASLGPLVSSLVEANGFWSFAVLPDGSEQGAPGAVQRASFKRWLEAERYRDGASPYAWVEVAYGGQQPRVISSDWR